RFSGRVYGTCWRGRCPMDSGFLGAHPALPVHVPLKRMGDFRAFSDLIESDRGSKLLFGRTFLTAGCSTLLERCSMGVRDPLKKINLELNSASERYLTLDPSAGWVRRGCAPCAASGRAGWGRWR